MVRIVGVQRGEDEFVLLQNQGAMRIHLRGIVVMADQAIGTEGQGFYAFPDDEFVQPGQYVLLRTRPGAARWSTTADGHRVYYTSMRMGRPVWSRFEGALHVLAPQHTYCGRAVEPACV